MPYSEHFNFVHIAIPKTGTTSVVRALIQLHTMHGGNISLYREFVDAAFRARYGLDRLNDRQPGRAKHLSAEQLRLVLGEERYDAAFRFTFVRNPWARAVSRYRFSHISNKPPLRERVTRRNVSRSFHRLDFKDWLRQKARSAERKGGSRNQLDKLIDQNGDLLVNFIGKLERVQDDFAAVCKTIGVEPIPVPHVNATARNKPYTEYYDDACRDMVAELYRRDIEAFGYEFGK